MLIRMKNKPLIVLLLIILSPYTAYAREDAHIYSEGLKAAQNGDRETAFMYFRSLLTDFADSKYSQGALFATGEYYFLKADFHDAALAFIRFIKEYPDSRIKPFVFSYLLHIAKKEKKESLAKDLEKSIVNYHKLSLLFRNFKKYEYRSGLSRLYKAVYYIDKVEFYIDGNMFAKISY